MNIFTQIGFTQKEEIIYKALLQIGSQAPANLAKFTKLSRTTVYSVLNTLLEKAFVKKIIKNKIVYFSPEHPSKISILLDKNIKTAHEARNEFKNTLPKILSLMQSEAEQVNIKYYEGVSGIESIYEDSLSFKYDCKYTYSSAPDVKSDAIKKIISNYLQKRIKKNIKAKVIYMKSKSAIAFQKKDSHCLRESVLVSKKIFDFSHEISIYGDRIAVMSLNTTNPYGFIIESKDIAKAQKSIFNLAWLGAKMII